MKVQVFLEATLDTKEHIYSNTIFWYYDLKSIDPECCDKKQQ